MEIKFKGTEPQYMTTGAAGADIEASKEVTIHRFSQAMVSTGLSVEIPEGFYGLLLPRSSICNKKGLRLANSAGVIDSDYRGEVKFCYRNDTEYDVVIEAGERIGQIIISPCIKAKFVNVEDLSGTIRGEGGFGSTGK